MKNKKNAFMKFLIIGISLVGFLSCLISKNIFVHCSEKTVTCNLDSNEIDSEMTYKVKKVNQPKEAYVNHCWNCGSSINSNYCLRCRTCGWYICNSCGACDPDCTRRSYNTPTTSSSNSSKKEDNSWVWFLIIGGVVVGGIYLYKKAKS